MRKYLFFLPVVLWTLLALFLESNGVQASLIVWIFWLAMLLAGGILLQKGNLWGGLIGMCSGVHMIYMGICQTSQMVHAEIPMGIVCLIFFLIVTVAMYLQRRRA